jgi:xanthine dehydrogenase accessory factor
VLVATLMTAPAGVVTGAKLLVRGDGSSLGSLGVPVLDAALVRDAPELLRKRTVGTLRYGESGESAARSAETYAVMIEVHERPARLLIAGGGHVGKALSVIASMCGFRVTVVDDRPEWANEERFPEADAVIRGRFDDVLGEYPVDGNTYVVCVTRGHRHDEVSLRGTIGRGAAYVGMIGSRRRARAVLEHILAEGADPAAVAAVRTPIGLDIGADTPEEIAVAIMAEIIQARRGGTGGTMSAAAKKPR